ncbi:MBOAT family O-acyltransferase [Dyadobacter sp. CY323]|uniref:MBOAT family O-acyltransferase n=1 Tax=Dyadobacter sp. CY323 TaxID=2907302 RepID=UPI001F43EFA5|nr:MBOAT family O-acyltransferase [Dyadobacter sp. CY323]MCE6990943.1 MBOAT family protein [Dyadobacter sp. CY323]
MLFNSVSYVLFLPAVFTLYWLLKRSVGAQNILLLSASYFFYGCWDWRFLGCLIFSTLLDYYSGLKIKSSKTNAQSRMWLIISIVINVGLLAYFKYYNFFAESLIKLMASVGIETHLQVLNIVLPIGISFYTFHGLSYVIDIYNKRIDPSENLVNYSLFVSFFPLLVAGPIERATHLLPQIEQPRIFRYEKAVDGMRQMLWGFFKKIVVADSCATYVNMTFDNPTNHSGSTLLFGAILFAFQIYGDFSGYSDIALGTARLFGFELLNNFTFPYFSRDIAEFWRRWHISLSSWFKDYVYFPLGGSRLGLLTSIRNTVIIFLISGFWHGANWTFVVWGLYHALLFLPLLLFNINHKHKDVVATGLFLPNLKEWLQIISTFFLVTIGWIFFRSSDLAGSFVYIKRIISQSLFTIPLLDHLKMPLAYISICIVVEWLHRDKIHGLQITRLKLQSVRWILYLLLVMVCIAQFRHNQEFIYFQF